MEEDEAEVATGFGGDLGGSVVGGAGKKIDGMDDIVDTHADLLEGIRGEGLLLGLKCRVPNGEIAAAARGEGLLLVPAGDNVVRLLPHIGPAVLAAITLRALIAPRGSVSIADTVPALLAEAIAAVAWRRTKSLPVALFGGMAV